MPKRVLVVDDQQYLRDVQVLLLKEAGYTVRQAKTGAEATASVAKQRPDLVMMDVKLPDQDGIARFLPRAASLQA